MLDNNYKEALTEVSEILKYIPKEDKEQLPKSVTNFIEKNKSEEYSFEIDKNIPFEEQNLKEETESFLAILMLKYWDKENRDSLLKTYVENEKRHQDELRERYKVDIFGQDRESDTETDEQEELALIEYKKGNIFTRVFKSISRFIKDFFADE